MLWDGDAGPGHWSIDTRSMSVARRLAVGRFFAVVLGVAWAWLWTKFKLLIPGNFLALAMALALTDSKELLGFGDDARRG
jgi:hypothetical protein